MLLAVLAATTLQRTQPAVLVIENAKIWSDGLPTFAEFAAVEKGRFVYVGKRDPSRIGPKTVRVDAQGRTVLPGLIDSHAHMVGGGESLAQLDLRPARSKEEFIRMVADYAATLEPGRWILGGGWSIESWPVQEAPRKEWVDGITGGRPLWLDRMDGHSGLANSAALSSAGITKDTKDPAGGVVDRDPGTGEPTGILRETAQSLVGRRIPSSTRAQRLAALHAAMREANRNGITAVSDITSVGYLDLYEELDAKGELTVRFGLYPTTSDIPALAARAKSFQGRPGWTQIRGFKSYMDGSLGSRTAYMRAPFLDNEPDNSGWRGLPMPGMIDGGYEARCRAASSAGLQAICHAIGDEGNHQLLNILERAYGQRLREARCRDEHTQHVLPQDIPRFGALGVIASIQPYHKSDDGRYAEKRLGEARSRASYAFKSLLDSGAVVAFGSDWPVVSINPFLGVEAAVTGRILDSGSSPPNPRTSEPPNSPRFWMTQENLTVAEALRCYTTRGAYAMFMENEIGKIAPGYRADFLVLNASPFKPNPKWEAIRPEEVWVEGRRVK